MQTPPGKTRTVVEFAALSTRAYEVLMMGLGVGILLVAVGAVLAFAVKVNPTNGALDLHTIGWILVGVGALGIVLSMAFWSSWAGPGRLSRRTTNVGPTGDTSTTTVEQR